MCPPGYHLLVCTPFPYWQPWLSILKHQGSVSSQEPVLGKDTCRNWELENSSSVLSFSSCCSPDKIKKEEFWFETRGFFGREGGREQKVIPLERMGKGTRWGSAEHGDSLGGEARRGEGGLSPVSEVGLSSRERAIILPTGAQKRQNRWKIREGRQSEPVRGLVRVSGRGVYTCWNAPS